MLQNDIFLLCLQGKSSVGCYREVNRRKCTQIRVTHILRNTQWWGSGNYSPGYRSGSAEEEKTGSGIEMKKVFIYKVDVKHKNIWKYIILLQIGSGSSVNGSPKITGSGFSPLLYFSVQHDPRRSQDLWSTLNTSLRLKSICV